MKIFLSFILIFMGAVAFSQESKIAPLEEALEKAESDSAKVRLYCELALASRRFDLEQAKKYTKNALNLAIAINERISLTRAISSFASYENFTGKYDRSIEYSEKAIQILKADTNNLGNNTALENKLLGNLYTAKGMSYDFKSEHPQAIFFSQKSH